MSNCSKRNILLLSDQALQNVRRIVELFNGHNPGMKIRDEAEAVAIAVELYLDQLIDRYLKGTCGAGVAGGARGGGLAGSGGGVRAGV